jgi:hypothetical protein
MPLPKIFRLSLVPRVLAHCCINLRLPVPGAYVTMSCLNNFLVAVSGAKIHSSLLYYFEAACPWCLCDYVYVMPQQFSCGCFWCQDSQLTYDLVAVPGAESSGSPMILRLSLVRE